MLFRLSLLTLLFFFTQGCNPLGSNAEIAEPAGSNSPGAFSNSAPVPASSQTETGTEDIALNFTVTAATDPEEDDLTYTVVTAPTAGTLTNCMDQSGSSGGDDLTCTYTPDANGFGTAYDSFSYVVNDGSVDSETNGTVTFNITAVPDTPTLTSISTLATATEDTGFSITYAALAAAADEATVDGDTLEFRVEAISSGTLTENGIGVTAGTSTLASGETWVWTPASNANGTLNAFTVKAYNGTLASDTAIQVQVTTTAVNDNPTITNSLNDIAMSDEVTVSITANDGGGTDEDAQTFSFSTCSSSDANITPTCGAFTGNSATVSFAVTAGAEQATITLAIQDSGGATSTDYTFDILSHVSCKAINDAGYSYGDGTYWIDIDGAGGDNSLEVYCDMTVDSGGWTLVAKRAGGTENIESCGGNLNAFMQATCGNVDSLTYGTSYNIGDTSVKASLISDGEWLFYQNDAGGTRDTDDAFIIHHGSSIFPNTTGMSEIAVTQICDINNTNCDSTDTYVKYAGTGWFNGGSCSGGLMGAGATKGNFGYCHNGLSGASNALFGNRNTYAETKIWGSNVWTGAHWEGEDWDEFIFVR